MMDRSVNDRATWMYHHRSEIDNAHYQKLMAENKDLDARVKELESGNTPRDPAYQPPGVDKDLVYKTDADVDQETEDSGWSAGQWQQFFGRLLFGLFFVGIIGWLVFFKRWNVR